MDLKSNRSKILKNLFWANLMLALVIRVLHGGRMTITLDDSSIDTGVINYRIAGVNSQPEHAFEMIRMPEEGMNYNVSYSCFGFGPAAAGSQLENHIYETAGDASHVNIFSISVGTKVMQYLDRKVYDEVTTVAINPCSSVNSLKPSLGTPAPSVAITAEVLTIPLGCLALLPVIPTEDGCYSAVLWADLLMATSRTGMPPNTSADIAIWSKDDQLLDHEAFNTQYKDAVIEEVDSKHAEIGNNSYFVRYQAAIDNAWHEYLPRQQKAP